MQRPWKGFVFLDVNEDLIKGSHDLGYGLTLRKATLEEILDKNVERSYQDWSERRGTSKYLYQRTETVKSGESSFSTNLLPDPKQWRYAVIECVKGGVLFGNVNLAFSISDTDLRMGLILFEGDAVSQPYLTFPMLNIRSALGGLFVDHEPPAIINLPTIKQDLAYVLDNLDGSFSNEIRNILHMFTSLDNLPDSSVFKVLGYFSVIEGLLSHSPQVADPMDSIQRQLIRNINLLNNRLKMIEKEIDFQAFGDCLPKKVLQKLYAYRSSIAHGGSVENSIGEIKKLRMGNQTTDSLWVHDWMRSMTKKLLLCAIREPELVCDLK